MDLRLYNITPRLQPYVKVICSMENKGCPDNLSRFRVLPDTCVELFVNYIEPEQIIIANNELTNPPRSFILARMSRFMDVQSHGQMGCISICFFPGAASRFFHLPMNEVSDTLTDLGVLWKKTANEMEDRIANAKTNHERVVIIQEYLLRQLAKKRNDDEAVQYCLWQINLYKGLLSVNELSGKANISQRQLGRRFNNYLGLSPKEFTRISRFIHSLTQLKKYPSISLTEVAYESGYYDQAHFIHDYKEFAGVTPGELITSKNILY